MAPPTILFVAGAGHHPSCFDKLIAELPSSLKTLKVGPLPSAGARKALPDYSGDVTTIRKAIELTLNGDRDVIVVCHSYGGMPTSDAVHGLGRKDRRDDQSAVIGLVYLTAFALPVGTTLLSCVGGKIAHPMSEEDGLVTALTPKESYYTDCSEEDVKAAVAQLSVTALGAFTTPQAHASYAEIPSAYLICTQDKAIPAGFQEKMAVGGGFNLVERIDVAHSPFLTKPRETAAFVVRALCMFEGH